MQSFEQKLDYIKDCTNQEEIIKLAQRDSDWRIRQVAVEHVLDEDALKCIVENELIASVSINAVSKIKDTDFLVDTCLNHPNSHLRLATLNHILDDALLSSDELNLLLENIALKDPEDFICRLALEQSDFIRPEVLVKIAESKRDVKLKSLAILRIFDENLLADFALNDSSRYIRRAAIENVNLCDEDVLGKIIKNDDDEFNRYLACMKITDRDYLLKLVFDESFHHCLDDLSQNPNFESADYFKSVFENDDEPYHRQVAAYLIDDSKFLDEIILNEPDAKIKAEAIRNRYFNNQKILDGLILTEENLDVLCEVVTKIANQDLLVDFIGNHLDNPEIVLHAISNLNDIEFLKELSANPDLKIRRASVLRICKISPSGNVLKEIALSESDCDVCIEAINSIESNQDLIEIADNRSEHAIRLASIKNIKAKRLIDRYMSKLYTPIENSLSGLLFEMALKDIALNDDDIEIRKVAISKLEDKSLLEELSLSDDDEIVEAAQLRLNSLFDDIKLISDEYILEKLCFLKDSDVSFIAQRQLDDLRTYEKRIREIENISDIGLLKGIALNDFNYYVRCEAEGRLELLLFNIRLDEIGRDENQTMMKNIAGDETYPLEIRKKAILNIRDEEFVQHYHHIF